MTVAIESSGRGPDLVLLHGWGFDRRVWDAVAGPLAKRFRVHAIDLPGHGDSPGPVAGDLDSLARAVLDDLPPQVALAGWSLGGLVAMRVAALAPSRIRAVAFVGATPRFTNGDGWHAGLAAGSLDALSSRWAGDPAGAWREFRHLVAAGSPSPRELLRTLPAAPRRASELAPGLTILARADLRGHLASLTMPALVIHGERDALVPVGAARFLAEALPRARLTTMADAGHALPLTHADAVCSALERLDA